MAGAERRVQVQLSVEAFEAVRELSELSGVPKGTFCKSVIEDFSPVFVRLSEMLRAGSDEAAFGELNAWIRGVKRDAGALREIAVPRCEGGSSTDGWY